MRKIALLPDKDRKEIFTATAIQVGIRLEAVEKDFWVCYLHDLQNEIHDLSQ